MRKLKYQLINDTNGLQIQNSLADLTKIQSEIGLNYSLQQYKKKTFYFIDRMWGNFSINWADSVRKLKYHLTNGANELHIQNL